MALEILGTIDLDGGLTSSTGYARLTADVNAVGDRLRTSVSFYVNKAAFDGGSGKIYLANPVDSVYDYNRQTDGVDLLDVAHNKVKTELEALGYTVTIVEL